MVTEEELRTLIARTLGAGATVESWTNHAGCITRVRIAGAKGIGPHPMPPIAAAERMREFLHRREPRAECQAAQ